MKGGSINERAFQKNGDIYNNIINCRLYYRLNYGSCPWSIAANHGSCSWYLYHHPRHCVNGLGLLNPHNLYSIFWRNVWFTIVLVSMPSVLPVIFTIALGIWIILSSINVISIAITVKKEYSNWCLLLLLGIIDLICGIIILFNPFASLISLVVLSGVIIMVHSIVNIADMIIIRNNVKDIEKAVEANIKGLKKSNS